jgi:hypothetical protein
MRYHVAASRTAEFAAEALPFAIPYGCEVRYGDGPRYGGLRNHHTGALVCAPGCVEPAPIAWLQTHFPGPRDPMRSENALERFPFALAHGTRSDSLVTDAFSLTPRPHAVGKCSGTG